MGDDKTTPYANSVFEQPWWLDLVAAGSWQEVFLKNNDKVVARFPYVMKGKRIVMPPFTQTLGIWFDSSYLEAQIGNSQYRMQKEAINDLLSLLPLHKSIDIRLDSSNNYLLPYRWKGFRYEPTVSYRINNLNSIDNIISNYSKHCKRDVKFSQKKVFLKDNPSVEEFLTLVCMTFSRQNRKLPYECKLYHAIIKNAIDRGNGKILIATDESLNNHAGAFLLFDEKVCYYLMAGLDYNFRNSCAQTFILNESIKYASNVSKKFDFEGSSIEGIENFFRQFGGEMIHNYRIVQQPFINDFAEILKPKIKKILKYKM